MWRGSSGLPNWGQGPSTPKKKLVSGVKFYIVMKNINSFVSFIDRVNNGTKILFFRFHDQTVIWRGSNGLPNWGLGPSTPKKKLVYGVRKKLTKKIFVLFFL